MFKTVKTRTAAVALCSNNHALRTVNFGWSA